MVLIYSYIRSCRNVRKIKFFVARSNNVAIFISYCISCFNKRGAT